MSKVDIIIPTYNRLEFLQNCLKSLWFKTKIDYRLFIIDDCSNDGTTEWLANLNHPKLQAIILNKERRGLTYGFDALYDFIQNMNWYYGTESEYLCLLQDDTEIMVEGWLDKLIRCYTELQQTSHYKIGFFSGHDASEHPTIEEYFIAKIKKSMRATNMIATWSHWKSIGKVPRLQPNGSERGFPSPSIQDRGKGSNFDLYLTGCQSQGKVVDMGRTTENSNYHQGKVCMVIPGLVKHMAWKKEDSLWGNENTEQEDKCQI